MTPDLSTTEYLHELLVVMFRAEIEFIEAVTASLYEDGHLRDVPAMWWAS